MVGECKCGCVIPVLCLAESIANRSSFAVESALQIASPCCPHSETPTIVPELFHFHPSLLFCLMNGHIRSNDRVASYVRKGSTMMIIFRVAGIKEAAWQTGGSQQCIGRP